MACQCESLTSWTVAAAVYHRREEGELKIVAIFDNNNQRKCINFEGYEQEEKLVVSDISWTGKRPLSLKSSVLKYAETNQESADLFAEKC